MKWEARKIGSIFTIIRNGASIKQTEGHQGIPITRIETISAGYIDSSKFGYANVEKGEYDHYFLRKGDILMSHINSWKHLGKTAIVKEDSEVIHGMNLLMLRPDSRVLYPDFVKYYFSTKEFKTQLNRISNQSVNQASFSVTNLKKLIIPIPPIETQKQIADILDKADALRRNDQELLQKYDELAQAVFYEMFGDPVKNEKGWNKKVLGKLLCIETKSVKPENTVGKHYIGLENIEKETGEVTISKEVDLKSNKFLFDSDCILYGKLRPYLKKVATPDFNGVCSTDIFPIRCLALDKVFALTILRTQHFTDYATSSSVGANLPRVNKDVILSYETICPPLDLQNNFAKKTYQIRKMSSLVKKSIDAVNTLQSALFKKYFS